MRAWRWEGSVREPVRSASFATVEAVFEFSAELFQWSAKESTTWIFLSLPLDESEVIKEMIPTRRGFGSVPVKVRIGETQWTTSIFPDSKTGCYVLPVKKAVRKAEGIDEGDTAEVVLTVAPE